MPPRFDYRKFEQQTSGRMLRYLSVIGELAREEITREQAEEILVTEIGGEVFDDSHLLNEGPEEAKEYFRDIIQEGRRKRDEPETYDGS